MEANYIVINSCQSQIYSFSVNKDELHALLKRLQKLNDAACKLEIDILSNAFQKKDDREQAESKEHFEIYKKIIPEGFILKATITGTDDRRLYGSIDDIFKSTIFPNQIKTVYINTEITLQTNYNYYIAHSFELTIDFSQPHPFDLSLLPSQPTPNQSQISVQGQNDTWTNGVFGEFNNFVRQHPSKMTWLHRHSVYDFLVWFVAFPISFWISYRLSDPLNQFFDNGGNDLHFLLNAAYIYIFLISLLIFRILFNYARWIWPLVEYKSSKNIITGHRAIVTGISLSLLIAVIYDFIKLMFK